MQKILIIEDDIFIRDIAEHKLIEAGYVVYKTADGGSALAKVKEIEPDLVLLDLSLPNKHGFDVLAELREEGFVDLPVIIFSNENGPDIEENAQKLGATYFFKAMTGTGELIATVTKLLA